jgi:hypothetical protein
MFYLTALNLSAHRRSFYIIFASLLLLSLFWGTSTETSADQLADTTDFDNDSLGDLVVFDPSTASFTIRGSSNGGFGTASIGVPGSMASAGDFNGDGKADLASFNPSTVEWSISINGGSDSKVSFGNIGDIPVPGEYLSGDCSDLATYNSRSSRWMIRNCKNSQQIEQFFIGYRGSVPVAGDYDGDGKTDAAVFHRPTTQWIVRKSSTGEYVGFYFGLYFDIPAPADYTGSGRTQPGIYRPTTNTFYYAEEITKNARLSADGERQWGLPGDQHFLANVDGDSRADFGVYRQSTESIYLRTSTGVVFNLPFSRSSAAQARLSGPFNGTPPEISAGSTQLPFVSLKRPSYRVRGDYNRDGRADLAFARVERSLYRTVWSVLHLDGSSSLYVVHAPGDALVPGDYNGDGKTQPAVVYVNPGLQAAANLEWHIKNPDGSEDVRIWGKNGDSPLSGDFDCDGKNDLVVSRVQGDWLYWYMWLSSPLSTPIGGHLFGMKGDRAFSADMTGDGCDELVVARQIGDGIVWFYQTLGELTATQLDWGLKGDTLLPPSDYDGDGRGDLIVARPDGAGGVMTFVRRSTEWGTAIPFGLSGDVVLAGNFSGANIAEFGVYRRSNETYYLRLFNGITLERQFGTSADVIIRPDGTAVQADEGGVGSPGGGGGGGSCDVNTDFSDGGGNALWKPVSDNTGNPVFLLPAEYWDTIQEIEILSASGDLVVEGRPRNCCPNGNRAHYDVPRRASSLMPYAPITVRLTLSDGTTECREVPVPTQRYD